MTEIDVRDKGIRREGGRIVHAGIQRPDLATELITPERCFILESWNDESDPTASIARARGRPGVTTQLHSLDVDERYVVVQGRGAARIGDLPPADLEPGDVVVIPAGTPQQVTNTGSDDLVFYCVCTPRFKQEGYMPLA
jgi:mannose-6-phosphate isomerase-like protein (cupin superfamily)